MSQGFHLLISRIEEAIQKNLCSSSIVDKFPESLRSAIEYSVFPGGARIRPTILMSVAKACDDDIPEITDAAASALEMIHCASLVHDDLPCFDNGDTRRVSRQFIKPMEKIQLYWRVTA